MVLWSIKLLNHLRIVSQPSRRTRMTDSIPSAMTARVQTQLSSTAASPSPRNNAFRSNLQPNARSSFRRTRKRKFQDRDKVKVEGSNEEILSFEIQELLSLPVKRDSENAVDALSGLPETFTEIELTVSMLSSTGDGLAMHPSHPQHVFVVPFSLAGDTVQAKVIRHKPEEHHSLTDFISIIRPSPERDDTLVKCAYFAKCAGCQFQMLPYPDQLAHKTTILRKAYKWFSGLQPSQIPPIGFTIGSPMQYGYRTKLTPHFDAPPGARSARKAGERVHWTERPPIGFMLKNTRKTIDVEDCPIGTDAVRHGLKSERERIGHELEKYNRGSTLLLRENTTRIHDPTSEPEEASAAATAPPDSISIPQAGYTDYKTCITDPKGTSVEYVSQYVFSNPASAFFQNNNSILDLFTDYIRAHILPSPSGSDKPQISHLIDAYSGSGLFTITLSTMFRSSLGIDISPASIASALHNLKLNNLADQSEKKVNFIAADASSLFESITSPATETAVILDPPRKGCDEGFLGQLLTYRPERIVYVSCNVHTQARDIGILVRGGAYELESLQGFDFFPQTGHVEGVAVLRRCQGQDSTGEGDKVAPEVAKEERKVEGDLGTEEKADVTTTLVP